MVSANINVNVNVNVMELYTRRISMANVNMIVMQVYTQRISMANVNMNIMELYTRAARHREHARDGKPTLMSSRAAKTTLSRLFFRRRCCEQS